MSSDVTPPAAPEANEPGNGPTAGLSPPVAVVGLGASAGGLEALEKFLAAMPSDSGLGFVVVPHLSPDFKSLMDELLARHTRMRVHRVEDRMAVERNSIYVIPPRKEMIISDGMLLLRDKDPQTPLPLPIDVFLRSLAGDLRQRAIAVVLSGTGSDGSRALRDVHDAGGLIVVQSPETAKFDGMPRSAIDTGFADLVLAPEAMPAALLAYVEHARLRDDTGEPSPRAPLDEIEQIIQRLRAEYNIDFRHYKPSTLRRRVERRLLLSHTVDLRAYVEQLNSDRDELHSLYKDLLIGVTRFFRDRDAFDRLREDVIAPLVLRQPAGEDLRVWAAGCATGEEAYSLAITIHEQIDGRRAPDSVKIFATDVHRTSLEQAARGIYDERGMQDVSPARLERYFRRVKEGYQVVPELRKMVVFAPHDVVKDAPFTRLDLITCRNLLIYFEPLTQKKILSLFHFGLKTGGVLFLGASETPGDLAGEFDPIDRHWKIYRKKRDIRLPPDVPLGVTSPLMPQRPAGRAVQPSPAEIALRRAQDAVIQTFAPPTILVDARHTVLHTFAGGGQYLTQPLEGRASLNVLDLVDTELKLTINGALHRAAKDRRRVTYSGVRVQTPDGGRPLRVSVAPVDQPGDPGFLISLEPEDPPESAPAPPSGVDMDQMSRERIQMLERELQYTRENLQATLEEMETANEELQATNEELVASNEELQSTNEELHSVNEELFTVNTEHQQKIRELTELTEDMENLFAATDVGTIFLDRDLCVRKFTPQIARTFHLLPQDIGRHIDNFAHTLSFPELVDRLSWVLKTERRFEAQVSDERGVWYLMRVLPYRTDSGVQGVVVNLVDIDTLKQTERKLARMSKVFMDGADPIIIEDLDGRVVDVNHEAERCYGWTRASLFGRDTSVLVPPSHHTQVEELRRRCRQHEHVRNEESMRLTRAGEAHPVLLTMSLLTDEGGLPAGVASIAKDITRQKRAEQEARLAVERRDEFLAMLSHELRNPLAAAETASVLLARTDLTPEMTAQAASIVQRQTRHMARLLDDLLDVSRVVRGKISLHLRPTDVARTMREATEAVQAAVEARRQTLLLEVPPEPVFVNGDPARLRQIQENLLSNASKFTPAGGTITMSLQIEAGQAVLRVRDNGRGIKPEMLDAIFELFTQAEDPTLDRSQGGMGIGLTLVRQLVQLHGGTVRASSEGPGRGAELEVRMPVAEPTVAAAAPPPPEVIVAPQNRRVLLLEDNADAREALETMLMLEGFQVSGLPDGESGLKAILADPPDVALVDIGLPGIDGFELARRIRAALPRERVRLVALTGYGGHDDRRKVHEAGFDAHLVKPAPHDALLKALREP